MANQLLLTKLKRLKISVKLEGTKIIIGKPKFDPLVFWGLIISPLLISALIIYFTISSGFFSGKVIFIIIVLLGTSIFNFGRMGIKRSNNNSIKILQNSTIRIGKSQKFDNKNISEFIYEVTEIRDDVFQGKLLLKDIDNNSHVIFGFDDESEQLVLNDLKWFSDFFLNYVGKSKILKQ